VFKILERHSQQRQRWDSCHKQLVAGRNCIPRPQSEPSRRYLAVAVADARA